MLEQTNRGTSTILIPEPNSVEITIIPNAGALTSAVDNLENRLQALTFRSWELVRVHEASLDGLDLDSIAGRVVIIANPDLFLSHSSLESLLWPLEVDADLSAVVVHGSIGTSDLPQGTVDTVCLRKTAFSDLVKMAAIDDRLDAPGVASQCERIGLAVLAVQPSSMGAGAGETAGASDLVDQLVPTAAASTHAERQGKPLVMAVFPWMTVGGADRYNMDILTQAKTAGWDLTVVTTAASEDSWEPRFATLTEDIHKMSKLVRPVDYPDYFGYLLSSRSPDVVLVSNSEAGYLLLPFLRRRLPTATFVDLVHAEQPEWKDGGYARYSALYRDHLDLTITVSDHLAQWMVHAGATPDRVHTCRAGVDPDWWCPDRSARADTVSGLGLDPSSTVVCFNGRLSPLKQPDIFLEAVAYANRMGTTCSAVVMGDGEMRAGVEDLASELGVDIATIGAVNSETVRTILRATDVALLPSRAEGISIALLEAMACGVPVISADVGGQAELVTAECGTLIAPSSRESEIAAYGSALAELTLDTDLRERFGRAARARIVQNFTVKRTGSRFLELLELAQSYHATDPRPEERQSEADLSASAAVSYMIASRHATDLEVTNTWLNAQVESWEAESRRLTDQVGELKTWIADLEAGKSWLEGQVRSWKTAAEGQDTED